MFKEYIKIGDVECEILYNEDVHSDFVREAEFSFEIEDGDNRDYSYPVRDTTIADVFKIESKLNVEGGISTFSSCVIIPMYKRSFELFHELSQIHLQKHIDTLELVYHQKIKNKQNIIIILREQLSEFCNPHQ